MFKSFRRKPQTGPEPLGLDKVRVTLTIESVDPDAGPLSWTGREDGPKTLDGLEAAITTLAARGIREATDN